MNVVSILAHQDDEMFCLGTMLKCRHRGDHLAFVTLTDGARGFVQQPDIDLREAAGIRDAEMRALATKLDAEFLNLDEPDEFLIDSPAVRLKLIEAIRVLRADVIFTHCAEDYNLDHTITHSLVKQCAMLSSLPVLPTATCCLEATPAVFLIEPHGPVAFSPSHYVDISGFHAEKSELMRCHASQDEAFRVFSGHGLDHLIAKVSAFRGLQVGCEHAEAFVPMSLRGAQKPFAVLP